jgi:hypothetical protein
MKQPQAAQTSHPSGRRPPEYVIVVAQLTGRNWSNGPSLVEALNASHAPETEPRTDPPADAG